MNHKIDTSSWKTFKFKDIFFFKRGKRYKTEDHISGGIAYISSTKFNNGIDGYVSPPKYMTIYNNKITLNNSGSIGYCFYHPYDFVCSDHCTVIDILDKSQNLNIYIALFLKPIIEKIKVKYGFAREMSDDRLKNETVKLPINDNGDPDWEFIEMYMKKSSELVIFNNDNIKQKPHSKKTINMQSWKEFDLNDIFTIKPCKCSKSIDLIEGNDVQYIGAKKTNNGFMDLVKNDKKLITKGNCIAFICDGAGSVGYNTYQKDDFIGTTNVKAGYNKNLNIYSAMFIISILDRKRNLYSHGRKRGSRLSTETIKLPITTSSKVDWKFMEEYIKSLPYSSNL